MTLHWSGLSGGEIAVAVGRSAQTVSNLINSHEGQEILAELSRRTLDTVIDVQTEAQAFAPGVFHELVGLAFSSRDDRVRKSACTDILAIAGHQPVKRIAIERLDPVSERYRDKTEEELRADLLAELGIAGGTPAEADGDVTVH